MSNVIIFTHSNGVTFDGRTPAHVIDMLEEEDYIRLGDWNVRQLYENTFRVQNLIFHLNIVHETKFQRDFTVTGRRRAKL